MPECFKEIIDSGTEILLWEISESETELREGLTLSPQAKNRLSSRKSSVHRKGYLAVRQLLKAYGIAPQLHQYESNGAPYLTDGRFLSISHTKNVAAVAIANTPIGIDVEQYQTKIDKIAPRFMHAKEVEAMPSLEQTNYLTQIWTAKEAIYKVLNTSGIHFARQIYIHPIEKKASKGTGEVYLKETTHNFNLYFFYFHNFCATLAKPN